MEWKEIIEILVAAGLIGGIFKAVLRLGKVLQKIENIDATLVKMDKTLNAINDRMNNIETRISRVEGYLMGPQVLIEKPMNKG